MKKISIVIVEEDEKYLMPLELKFIQEYGEKLDLTVISDKKFMATYFSSPRQMDVLIINENLYNSDLQKHNIMNTFVLTEYKEIKDTTCDLNIHTLYKYTSVKEIFSEVNNNISIDDDLKGNSTKVIMVYSAGGGSGKTTISIGLSAILKNSNKKVLYINTENIQSFNFLTGNEYYNNSEFEKFLSKMDSKIMSYFDESISKRPFDYLVPFKRPIALMNISIKNYKFLIDKIKESGRYEYIVVDTSSEFDIEKSMLMSYSDKVIVLTKQNKVDVSKLSMLMENIDYSNQNKFIFICNNYEEREENFLIKEKSIQNINIAEYVNRFREDEININFLSKNKSLSKLIYMFV